MSTAVIVVAYRSHDWLSRCLEAAVQLTDELIVIDNGSGGAVTETAKPLGARVVPLRANVGLPAAINTGLRATAADVIGLLNDDAVPEAGWLTAARASLADTTVGAVAPKLLFARPFAELDLGDESHQVLGDPRQFGRQVHSATVNGVDVLEGLTGAIYALESDGPRRWRWTTGAGPIYAPLPDDARVLQVVVNGEVVTPARTARLVNNAGSYLSVRGFGGDLGLGQPDDGRFDKPGDRFAGCGAGLVTTRDVIANVGEFAGHFFAYYEDIDWCWRAQLAGLRVRYEPQAVVHHVSGLTSGGPSVPAVRALAARNRLLCLARNAPVSVAISELRAVAKDEAGRPRGRSSLARHLPAALTVERRVLARRWKRSPRDVWDQWAGREEF